MTLEDALKKIEELEKENIKLKELNLLMSSFRLFQVENALVEPRNVRSVVQRILEKQDKIRVY